MERIKDGTDISQSIWIEAYRALLRSECLPSYAAQRADESVAEWKKRYPADYPTETDMLEWLALTGQIRCLDDCLVGLEWRPVIARAMLNKKNSPGAQ